MRLFYNLDKTKKDFDDIDKSIKRKENCLKMANTIKDKLEFELELDKKKRKKLNEVLKIFVS
ncbi:MAG: hypothetical protein ACE5RH_01700 [Nitrosarchaeum sp.]